jgi:hypothetical protein
MPASAFLGRVPGFREVTDAIEGGAGLGFPPGVLHVIGEMFATIDDREVFEPVVEAIAVDVVDMATARYGPVGGFPDVAMEIAPALGAEVAA